MRKPCCGSCSTDRRRVRPAVALIAVALLAVLSCASRSVAGTGSRRPPAPKSTFFNEGELLLIAVDARAARLAGPSEFLPLQVLVENRGQRTFRLERESFVLERPDGMRLPISTTQEFRRDYQRSLADAHLGTAFIDTIAGRFPEPPFHWQRIDFFPPRSESTAPRQEIDLRLGDVVFGYLYFRQPDLDPPGIHGVYKLLVKPGGGDTTYVVDLMPYDLR